MKSLKLFLCSAFLYGIFGFVLLQSDASYGEIHYEGQLGRGSLVTYSSATNNNYSLVSNSLPYLSGKVYGNYSFLQAFVSLTHETIRPEKASNLQTRNTDVNYGEYGLGARINEIFSIQGGNYIRPYLVTDGSRVLLRKYYSSFLGFTVHYKGKLPLRLSVGGLNNFKGYFADTSLYLPFFSYFVGFGIRQEQWKKSSIINNNTLGYVSFIF